MKKTKQQLIESGIEKITRRILKEEPAKSSYYANELNRINVDSEYSPMVVFTSGDGSGKTKTLNVNRESIPIIIKWLKSIESKLPY